MQPTNWGTAEARCHSAICRAPDDAVVGSHCPRQGLSVHPLRTDAAASSVGPVADLETEREATLLCRGFQPAAVDPVPDRIE